MEKTIFRQTSIRSLWDMDLHENTSIITQISAFRNGLNRHETSNNVVTMWITLCVVALTCHWRVMKMKSKY